MVSIVRKIVKGHTYIYIYKSVYDKKLKKGRSIFVKYLGREDKYTAEDLARFKAQYGG